LEEIFSVEGVDAFIVGPYDLSGSLGVPGDFEDKKVEEALDKIVDISKNMNMSSGYHVVSTDYNLVKEKIKQGYSFIAYGVDFLFLGESARGGLAAIKN